MKIKTSITIDPEVWSEAKRTIKKNPIYNSVSHFIEDATRRLNRELGGKDGK